jgi:hypothetical protein
MLHEIGYHQNISAIQIIFPHDNYATCPEVQKTHEELSNDSG